MSNEGVGLIPLCPACGCAARVVVLLKARCVLLGDGTPGKVISASRDEGTIVQYECGGGHTFNAEQKRVG